MNLKNIQQSLLPQLLKLNFGAEIFQQLKEQQHLFIEGAAGSSPSLLVAKYFLTSQKTILYITHDKEEAHYITTEMEELLGEEQVLYFPATHLEPYRIEKTQNANLVLRTEVLNRLNSDQTPKVIVAHFSALSEKVLKKEDFKDISHHIKTGDPLDHDFTEKLLHQFNFNLTDFVSEPGEFAVRGGIVDIFSYSNEKPYRISLFGNRIESIKTFDTENQLSIDKIEEFQLISNMNFSVQSNKISFLELLPQNSTIITKDTYLGLNQLKDFYAKAETNFSRLSKDIKHQSPEELFISEKEFLYSYKKLKTIDFSSNLRFAPWSSREENINPIPQNEEIITNNDTKKNSDFAPFEEQKTKTHTISLFQQPQPIFHKNFEMLAKDFQKRRRDKFEIWISFSSEKQRERLEEILASLPQTNPLSPRKGKSPSNETEIPEKHRQHGTDNTKNFTSFEKRETEQNSFNAFKSELHEGFIDFKNKIAVYTDHQIFDRYQRFKAKNSFAKSEQLTLKDLTSLKVGDYITHIDHGIGKFLGLVKINNNGKTQECFKLSYRNGDLLYVSIHSLHKISKYDGPDGKEIFLSKLGSPTWKNLKQKTKTKVKQIAFDLIKLYAQRKTTKGFAYSPDTFLQNELEASFLYEDTPDQEKATLDVKTDMEAETVMDRLICGDVGFGKTEIAIRAAFKAVTDRKQVAILVPTTILAFQHYRSFKERLKDFPVNISYLNRFRTTKQKNETLEQLQNGTLNIVIGTHQLVSDKVKFKDLGLLIIDEEHKFGVSVKDKLKTLKSNIDTLTLTATPIPRTLQFSLMAARDLSVITTPPANRQPIDTQIINFNEETLRNAISHELQRDGQVYFINNKVENLTEIAGLIRRLIPNARVITGHGQMDGKELETRILDFMEGKYDILISTTIVESGVDVPNANTIFINDAQRFGMADLHQMRGRVGRSNRKAFCYLITPPYDIVTSDARKRLEAISQFSDLGNGFQIAMKDLEIRGAGDLLGGEQSGFINEMGFETYQKIMQEALEELQHEIDFEQFFENKEDRKKIFQFVKEVNIDTDLELILPDHYINSTKERLNLYQKLAEINNKATLEKFANELTDRFGKLPEESVNLLKSVELKWLAREIGFEKIVMKNDIFLGYFPNNPQDKFYQSKKFQHIISYLTQNPTVAQLKEKTTKGNYQLMIRKDKVKNVTEVTKVMREILGE